MKKTDPWEWTSQDRDRAEAGYEEWMRVQQEQTSYENPASSKTARAIPRAKDQAWLSFIEKEPKTLSKILGYAKRNGLPAPVITSKGWLDVFGCGTWGCVVRSTDPSIVIKVTVDDSETAVVKKLLRMGSGAPDGIVRYFGAWSDGYERENDDGQAGTTFVLWREEATKIGDYDDKPKGLLDSFNKSARVVSDNWYYAEQQNIEGRFAKALGIITRRLLNAGELEYPDGVSGKFRMRLPGHGQNAFAKEDSMEYIGLALLSAQHFARKLAQDDELHLIGSALLQMMSKGILLADTRDANIGWVDRGWVITDPGYSFSSGAFKPKPLKNPVMIDGEGDVSIAPAWLEGGQMSELEESGVSVEIGPRFIP